jgi:hypothetical protein
MVVRLADGIPLASSNLSPRLRVEQVVICKVVFNIDPLVTKPDCPSANTNVNTFDIIQYAHIVKSV